jgi:hypothetical protein
MDITEYDEYAVTALFPGICAVCSKAICVGDTITDVGGLSYAHVACVPDYVPE